MFREQLLGIEHPTPQSIDQQLKGASLGLIWIPIGTS